MDTDTLAKETDKSSKATDINGKRQKKGLCGSTLKMIAIITMFIDHFAAVILDRYLISKGILYISSAEELLLPENRTRLIIYIIDMVMRLVGRLGFPLFCFLMVEGFHYTRSRTKYAARLLLFAVISEIPFDLAFNMKVLEFTYQNVFFTLFVGLLTIWGLDTFITWVGGKIQGKIRLLPQTAGVIVITAAGMAAAALMKTDYAATGVLTIAVMFLVHKKSKGWSMAAGCGVLTISMPIEFTCFLTVLLAAHYNGKRGWNLKYFFYLFYPGHIFLLYLVCRLLGI